MKARCCSEIDGSNACAAPRPSGSGSKRRRFLLAAAFLAVLLFGLPGMPAPSDIARAAVFPDVEGHWAEETVAWAVSEGIVTGYPDGLFRPNEPVSEPEFLAMLIRAFPEAGTPVRSDNSPWFAGYYDIAADHGWTVFGILVAEWYTRGHVAQLIASTQGRQLSVTDAVQYLLDRGLSRGKTSPTVEGYRPDETLTRAEAAQFIRNLENYGLSLEDDPSVSETPPLAEVRVRGIAIGDTEDSVRIKLGPPSRVDVSHYGFSWLVYNGDPANYTLIGVQSGRVAGLYTSGGDWSVRDGTVRPGMNRSGVERALGQPETYIMKGNTRFNIHPDDLDISGLYRLQGVFVKFYYDNFQSGIIAGIKIVDSETELALRSFYGRPEDRLRESFERESFELANAVRAQRGLDPFAWNDRVAAVARKHSEDMAARGYFDHVNPDDESPGDRLDEAGLDWRGYAENIAAGQSDAIDAHHAWMNSEGHRNNLMSSLREIGVGVSFGGDYSVYYTQNFFTPRN
jgi:uncharacterized protein YkwD